MQKDAMRGEGGNRTRGSHSKLWITLLPLLVLILLQSEGCGWSTLWYENQAGWVETEFGDVGIVSGLSFVDSTSGDLPCGDSEDEQYSGWPKDSLAIAWVRLIPKDTTLSVEFVADRYEIRDLRVWHGSDTLTPTRCADSTTPPTFEYASIGPDRLIYFGPFDLKWPYPDTVGIEFDFVTLDATGGNVTSREHFRRITTVEKKSFWRDFLDGR